MNHKAMEPIDQLQDRHDGELELTRKRGVTCLAAYKLGESTAELPRLVDESIALHAADEAKHATTDIPDADAEYIGAQLNDHVPGDTEQAERIERETIGATLSIMATVSGTATIGLGFIAIGFRDPYIALISCLTGAFAAGAYVVGQINYPKE